MMKTILFSFTAILILPFCIIAGNATVPGEISVPYPTVTNLAIEWLIDGDDNLNCTVNVKFREKGASEWRNAMLLRRIPAGENLGFSWKNKCSGSIFNLKPGTEYEIKLSLSDPDGGSAEKIITAVTRPVPRISEGAVITDIPAGNYGVLTPENGTQSSPRVYRSVDGSAIYDYINLQNRQWVYLWGLTVKSSGKNSARAIRADGAKNCVIRYCKISGLYGITAYGEGLTNCYIGDNVITGATGWADSTMGAEGANEGEGIQFTGAGNVICHNTVTAFRDCISTMEDEEASDQLCIDIYNNDIYVGADDAVEADFCMGNCRIMRNRITNCYVGLSSQPGLGGPTYFIRNVMYNVVHGAFKFKRNSRGDIALHNTVVKVGAGLAGNDAMDFAFFRNNLAFGGPTGGVEWGGYGAGNPYAADIRSPGEHSSFDYDAVGVWGVNYIAKIGGRPFSEVEPNGIGDIKLEEVFPSVEFPNPPVPEREPQDLRPAAGCIVVDKGEIIPNINDGFLGKGPDCGAYEAGEELPVYGPRPYGIDEETSILKRIYNYFHEPPGYIGKIYCIENKGRYIEIWYNMTSLGRVVILLNSISGRIIHVIQDCLGNPGMYRIQINTNELASGCYLVSLQAGNFITTERIMVR